LAARLFHRIDLSELKGRLFLDSPKGLKLAEISKKGARTVGALDPALRAAIARRKPDLVILDPFIKLHSLAENANEAMDFVADLLVRLAAEYDIAVDTPAHTRKGALSPGDADARRGASAQTDAGRLDYTLTVMSDDEAKLFGIVSEDRHFYLRLDKAKVNLLPPARKAEWFRLVGVSLDNGTADYPDGDYVQTIEPWTPPNAWEGLDPEALNATLEEIDAGLPNGQRYSDARSAKPPRAAWCVVQSHCPDRTEAQCREIIRSWVQQGVLIAEEYPDPVQRKPLTGLRRNPNKTAAP
jgi:hypothetical protein